ncbi:MAG TPA: serine hydrolase domain-containing protein, partial [Nannocystis sp.]
MRESIVFGLSCLVLACTPTPTPDQGVAVTVSVPRPERFEIEAIDAYVRAQVEKKGFVGLSLAVVRNGEVVLARGYGKRSLADGAAVDEDTVFAIGSVTKQFTCASALLLAEDGKLRLDDKVSTYRPELARAADITLYDLLSNVSGYPDYYPLDFVDERMATPVDPDALLRQYAGGTLDFEPGSRWSYSNTGFVLAGRVIEAVSGQSFDAFLKERIFGPVGMQRSFFTVTADTPGLATGYTTFALGEPRPAAPEAAGWMHAAGAIYATATDLARWDLALIDGKLLSADSWHRMTTPRTLTTGELTDYGCGVAIARRGGETVVQHSGAVSGFLAWNAMIPRTRSAVIMLANADFVDGGGLHGELLSLLIEADRPRPTVPGPGPRETALALLHQMQAGEIDRAALGEPFSKFLDEQRLQEAAPRLRALGEPTAVVVERLSERGGMEVASLRFHFAG